MLVACGACAPSNDGLDSDRVAAPAKQFPPADVLAARALSIGSRTEMLADSDPFDRALLCLLAIQTIGERFSRANSADPSYNDAIEQAGAIFEQRARLAAPSGITTDEIRRRSRELAVEHPDESARVRLALTCIRDLQNNIAPS